MNSYLQSMPLLFIKSCLPPLILGLAPRLQLFSYSPSHSHSQSHFQSHCRLHPHSHSHSYSSSHSHYFYTHSHSHFYPKFGPNPTLTRIPTLTPHFHWHYCFRPHLHVLEIIMRNNKLFFFHFTF